MNEKTETVTLETMDDVVTYLSQNTDRVSIDVDNINIQFDEMQNKVDNVKNDFAVWGKRKGSAGNDLPIHLRCAIDRKPTEY